MPSIFQMLPMILSQNIGSQRLDRVLEPEAITSAEDHVAQYDRVMETKLAISYAIAVDTIYRARANPLGGTGLDIACGPGHLSLLMARSLQLKNLIGIDLSEPMVAIASGNAAKQNMSQVKFQTGDATSLTEFQDHQFDLATLMDAAHHMPTIDVVRKILIEMDRVTQPDGLVLVMDLVRLRTQELTESYIQMLAHDYVARGLPHFLVDFRNSMYAAWTTGELAQAVPWGTDRNWCLVVPRGLPFAQFLIGFPRTRSRPFVTSKSFWSGNDVPVVTGDRFDYRMGALTMRAASIRTLAR